VDHLGNAAEEFGVLLDMRFKESILTEIGKLGLSDPVDMVALFMRRYAEHAGKQRWGIKQPFGIFYVQRLLKRFSDLKVIHIIRDPRATVAHRMGKELNGKENLVRALQFSRSCSKMLSYGKHIKGLCSANYLELRYEDRSPIRKLF
jgi:hypothetical protein